jgi:hypothetical protein
MEKKIEEVSSIQGAPEESLNAVCFPAIRIALSILAA